jgi:hypothetical protein
MGSVTQQTLATGASNTAVVTINTGVPISIRVVALGLASAGSTAQYDNVYQITVWLHNRHAESRVESAWN